MSEVGGAGGGGALLASDNGAPALEAAASSDSATYSNFWFGADGVDGGGGLNPGGSWANANDSSSPEAEGWTETEISAVKSLLNGMGKLRAAHEEDETMNSGAASPSRLRRSSIGSDVDAVVHDAVVYSPPRPPPTPPLPSSTGRAAPAVAYSPAAAGAAAAAGATSSDGASGTSTAEAAAGPSSASPLLASHASEAAFSSQVLLMDARRESYARLGLPVRTGMRSTATGTATGGTAMPLARAPGALPPSNGSSGPYEELEAYGASNGSPRASLYERLEQQQQQQQQPPQAATTAARASLPLKIVASPGRVGGCGGGARDAACLGAACYGGAPVAAAPTASELPHLAKPSSAGSSAAATNTGSSSSAASIPSPTAPLSPTPGRRRMNSSPLPATCCNELAAREMAARETAAVHGSLEAAAAQSGRSGGDRAGRHMGRQQRVAAPQPGTWRAAAHPPAAADGAGGEERRLPTASVEIGPEIGFLSRSSASPSPPPMGNTPTGQPKFLPLPSGLHGTYSAAALHHVAAQRTSPITVQAETSE